MNKAKQTKYRKFTKPTVNPTDERVAFGFRPTFLYNEISYGRKYKGCIYRFKQ